MKGDPVLDYLRDCCRGIDSAMTSKGLELALGISGQQIREKVNALRRNGVPICSGSCGYYYAENKQDIENTIAQLEARINGISAAVDGLRRVNNG